MATYRHGTRTSLPTTTNATKMAASGSTVALDAEAKTAPAATAKNACGFARRKSKSLIRQATRPCARLAMIECRPPLSSAVAAADGFPVGTYFAFGVTATSRTLTLARTTTWKCALRETQQRRTVTQHVDQTA
jgi:hypothetical protein